MEEIEIRRRSKVGNPHSPMMDDEASGIQIRNRRHSDWKAGAKAEREKNIAWLLKYDTFSQYTGRDHSDLIRRLDIPNKEMEAFTGKKY